MDGYLAVIRINAPRMYKKLYSLQNLVISKFTVILKMKKLWYECRMWISYIFSCLNRNSKCGYSVLLRSVSIVNKIFEQCWGQSSIELCLKIILPFPLQRNIKHCSRAFTNCKLADNYLKNDKKNGIKPRWKICSFLDKRESIIKHIIWVIYVFKVDISNIYKCFKF